MKVDNINFRGVNISRVANKDIKLYKVGPKDATFLNSLKNNFNVQKLLPNLSDEGKHIYNIIISRGTREAAAPEFDSILLTYKNTPCGLIVNESGVQKHVIDYLCTWPIAANGEKAPFGGQTVFQELFRRFLKSDVNVMELSAVKYGKAVDFYKKLGFKTINEDSYYATMQITRDKISETFKNLAQKIPLIQTNSNKNVDLNKELFSINYDEIRK